MVNRIHPPEYDFLQRPKATVIYMGEEHSIERVTESATMAAEVLHRSATDRRESLSVRQRLAVWFRDNDQITLCDPHRYLQINQTGNTSEIDISREK
jgi:hypothetical protein